MPTVKDKTTGDVVSRQPYTAEGTQRAKTIVEANPDWEIDYAPGGTSDGARRKEQMYAGGGQTGYNAVGNPMYDKGGKVKDNTINVAKKAAELLVGPVESISDEALIRMADRPVEGDSDLRKMQKRLAQKMAYKRGAVTEEETGKTYIPKKKKKKKQTYNI